MCLWVFTANSKGQHREASRNVDRLCGMVGENLQSLQARDDATVDKKTVLQATFGSMHNGTSVMTIVQ